MNITDKSLSDIEYAQRNLDRARLAHQYLQLLPDCIKQLSPTHMGLYISFGWEAPIISGPSTIYITLHQEGETTADIIQWSKQTMSMLTTDAGVIWDEKPNAYDGNSLEYKGHTNTWIIPIYVTVSKVPLSSKSCTILKRTEVSESLTTHYEVYCPEEVSL
jgi:hypothetical protein